VNSPERHRKPPEEAAGDIRRADTAVPTDLAQALLDVARATAACRDLRSLLRDLVEVLRRVTRFDRVAIVLYDPVADIMRLRMVAARHSPQVTELELPVAEAPAGIAWQTQQPLVIPDIDRETRFSTVLDILRREGMRSHCALPLTSPVRRLGGISFTSGDLDAFGPADVEFLRQLTAQVALAVDNTLHHEAAERAQQALGRERDRLQLLLEVNNALVSNLEPRALFGAIATCLRRVVSHDYTSLAVHDAERNAFDLWAIEFAGKGLIREHMTVPLLGSPAGTAFAAGKPVRLARADLESLSAEVAGLLLAEGVQSMCCVPLAVHDRRLGTLNLGRLGGAPFSDDEEELVAAVAQQVAFSVENSLAFQEIATLKDRLAAEKVYLEEEIRTNYNFEEIVGQSPALKRALHQVETVAPTDSTVLILGETGTGKELIARAIHDLSGRRARTFVKVNCAAIPTGLLESELFGHERGAFTGAITQRIGRFELANGGTLFLDEVGDLPIDLQPKLLRVLQEQEFERLGGTRTLKVDVRVVAATNSDLEDAVAAGTFRRDLYYRLNVFPIALPPLRERPEDIPDLVRTCVQRLARRLSKRIETIPADTMAALCTYDWPGNVRELENAIERAVILTQGRVLRVPVAEFRRRDGASPDGTTLEATEREAILRTLRETDGVLGGPRGAAARLGLKRTTLQSRMRRLGIRDTKA
jgi:formate hydrogenlyase transcriptional activator